MGKKNKKQLTLPTIKENTNKKIHFCLKYFNYDNIDKKMISNNQKFLKKTLLQMKELSNYTILELLTRKLIKIEESRETVEEAKRIIQNDEYFVNSCGKRVYDLFRGDFPLRVFGVLDSQKNCFNILMFDPTHDSR